LIRRVEASEFPAIGKISQLPRSPASAPEREQPKPVDAKRFDRKATKSGSEPIVVDRRAASSAVRGVIFALVPSCLIWAGIVLLVVRLL
jgi:hypothetical protein